MLYRTHVKLRRLSIYSNKLEGELPKSIVTLTNLRDIQISNNKFNGKLPDGIELLPRPKRLRTFANEFIGDIPQDPFSIDSEELVYQEDTTLSKI